MDRLAHFGSGDVNNFSKREKRVLADAFGDIATERVVGGRWIWYELILQTFCEVFGLLFLVEGETSSSVQNGDRVSSTIQAPGELPQTLGGVCGELDPLLPSIISEFPKVALNLPLEGVQFALSLSTSILLPNFPEPILCPDLVQDMAWDCERFANRANYLVRDGFQGRLDG